MHESSGAERVTKTAADRDVASLRESLETFLDHEIDVGSFPGAVYAIGNSRKIFAEGAMGHSVMKPAKITAGVDTIYDAASLTKPLITTTLALRSSAEGVIDLNGRVSDVLTELRGTDKEELTFIDLLSHRAGFQAWYPLYTQGIGDIAYLRALVQRPLRYKPGSREIYSCLGFILLHLALERVWKRKVEDLAREKIFEPLGVRSSHFNPPAELKYRIAATEWGNSSERQMVAERGLPFPHFRNYMIWGEVNDGNAFYMGGMAGNAGLFSTARDVWRLASIYLDPSETILPRDLVKKALRNYTVGLEENRALGWQLQVERELHPSAPFSESCFGHTGFTGTSVWLDPERDLVVALMTNRIHPTVQKMNMQAVRARFHGIVVEWYDAQ